MRRSKFKGWKRRAFPSIGYETVEPWPLSRHDQPPGDAVPAPKLDADKDNKSIILARVTRVSVETMVVIEAMKTAKRD